MTEEIKEIRRLHVICESQQARINNMKKELEILRKLKTGSIDIKSASAALYNRKDGNNNDS